MATIVVLACCFPYNIMRHPFGDGGYCRMPFLYNRLST